MDKQSSPAEAIAFYDPCLGAVVVATHSPGVAGGPGGGCDDITIKDRTWIDVGMTIQLPSFLQINWVKGLITIVFVQALITAIFTFNLLILLGVLVAEAAILAAVYVVLMLRRRQNPPMRGKNTAFEHPRKGLIYTVGGQDDTLRISLEQQKPSFFGFICTDQTKDRANELSKEFSLESDHYKMEVVDPRGIHEIQVKTELILEWMIKRGLKPEDIAIDITGGTKTMTIGIFLVAEEKHIDSQYIFCQKYLNNKCVDGTQEAILLSDFRD
jgi:hypothetical protein